MRATDRGHLHSAAPPRHAHVWILLSIWNSFFVFVIDAFDLGKSRTKEALLARVDYAEIGRQWLVSVLFFRVAETTYVLFLVPPDGCTFDYFNMGRPIILCPENVRCYKKLPAKNFWKNTSPVVGLGENSDKQYTGRSSKE